MNCEVSLGKKEQGKLWFFFLLMRPVLVLNNS